MSSPTPIPFEYGDLRSPGQITALKLRQLGIDNPKEFVANYMKSRPGITPAQPTKPATVSRNKAALRQAEQNVEITGLL